MSRAVTDPAYRLVSKPATLRDENFRPWRLELKQRIAEMLKSVKSRAKEKFAATQKKDKQFLKEKEKARQERAEHVARLRALRLAKEADDKEAAEKVEAGEHHSRFPTNGRISNTSRSMPLMRNKSAPRSRLCIPVFRGS